MCPSLVRIVLTECCPWGALVEQRTDHPWPAADTVISLLLHRHAGASLVPGLPGSFSLSQEATMIN